MKLKTKFGLHFVELGGSPFGHMHSRKTTTGKFLLWKGTRLNREASVLCLATKS